MSPPSPRWPPRRRRRPPRRLKQRLQEQQWGRRRRLAAERRRWRRTWPACPVLPPTAAAIRQCAQWCFSTCRVASLGLVVARPSARLHFLPLEVRAPLPPQRAVLGQAPKPSRSAVGRSAWSPRPEGARKEAPVPRRHVPRPICRPPALPRRPRPRPRPRHGRLPHARRRPPRFRRRRRRCHRLQRRHRSHLDLLLQPPSPVAGPCQ
mmetsp:Transcript_106812/g.341192  ORF Transcript_106812/g.341192 Transcript_106812/m.341192 type:complete len:207 (-) Transcript_106812:1705-2325(-)